jgi:hypothetical protein
VNSQGLVKIFTKGNKIILDVEGEGDSDTVYMILDDLEHHHWYSNIEYYLNNLTCLNGLTYHQRSDLRLKASWYCTTQGGLGWRDLDTLVMRCVDDVEVQRLMTELHATFCGGHYSIRITTYKILTDGIIGLLCSHMCINLLEHVNLVSFFGGKQHLASLHLQLVVVEAPFQQWDLDFIGEFKENSSNGFGWILIATYYFAWWVETIPTKRAIDRVVMDIIEERIITRFSVPSRITTDNTKAFSSTKLSNFYFKYGIVLSHAYNYYPQGNV